MGETDKEGERGLGEAWEEGTEREERNDGEGGGEGERDGVRLGA